jgi:hypothetical protein
MNFHPSWCGRCRMIFRTASILLACVGKAAAVAALPALLMFVHGGAPAPVKSTYYQIHHPVPRKRPWQ